MTDDLATRDPRKLLSKSYLVGADLCGNRAWLDLWYPVPFRQTEKVAFGSAVDLGVQIILGARDAGLDVLRDDPDRLIDPVRELLESRPTDPAVELDEVLRALIAFRDYADSVPADVLDFTGAARQHHVRVPVPGCGMVDGHPDLILRDGAIVDIKTSPRAKPSDAAATAFLELGLYALAREIETGERVPWVGYLTWVRSAKPYWQLVRAEVTDRMLTIAQERAAGTSRAIAADEELNRGAESPQNFTLTHGPRFPGLCGTCGHNPAFGGRCTISEGVDDGR